MKSFDLNIAFYKGLFSSKNINQLNLPIKLDLRKCTV